MLRFDEYELEPARRQLTRVGVEVHLTPKAFELLRALGESAPRVLSKQDLHRRLWPNGSVSDATLVGLVKELRRALQDKGRNPPLIRTRYRVGYSLNREPAWPPAHHCATAIISSAAA
ncbi:MAG: winged helix-turn-helix domain-containing protein [Pseudomonadota bacterium]